MKHVSELGERVRRLPRRRWVRVALVLLVLVGGYGTTFWAGHRVADSLTIIVTRDIYTFSPSSRVSDYSVPQ